MRHVGHEIATNVLQTLHVGDVVQHDHRPTLSRQIPQCRAPQSNRAVAGPAEQEIVFDRLAAVDRPQCESPQVGVADDLLQGAADGAGRVDCQQFRRGSVDADHPLSGVNGEDALDHAAQHRLLLRALPADRKPTLDELFTQRPDRLSEFG